MDARIGKAMDAAGWSGRVIAHRFDEPAGVVWIVLEAGQKHELPLVDEAKPAVVLAADPVSVDTSAMLKAELVERLAKLGLPTDGRKSELADRLNEALRNGS